MSDPTLSSDQPVLAVGHLLRHPPEAVRIYADTEEKRLDIWHAARVLKTLAPPARNEGQGRTATDYGPLKTPHACTADPHNVTF